MKTSGPLPPEPCPTMEALINQGRQDSGGFFSRPGSVIAVWSFPTNNQQRRMRENCLVPYGLGPKFGPPTLLANDLE